MAFPSFLAQERLVNPSDVVLHVVLQGCEQCRIGGEQVDTGGNGCHEGLGLVDEFQGVSDLFPIPGPLLFVPRLSTLRLSIRPSDAPLNSPHSSQAKLAAALPNAARKVIEAAREPVPSVWAGYPPAIAWRALLVAACRSVWVGDAAVLLSPTPMWALP